MLEKNMKLQKQVNHLSKELKIHKKALRKACKGLAGCPPDEEDKMCLNGKNDCPKCRAKYLVLRMRSPHNET